MTVDTSGIAAAQARVAAIQSLFGTPAPTADATATGASGSFDAALNRAVTGDAQTGARPGTAAPFTSAAAASPGAAAAAGVAAAATSGGANAGADAVLATAKTYLGVPYKWGGTNPAVGLDCSGFVQLVMRQHGISLPRVARDQARMGTRVESLADARPGDLVAFGSPAHHIGIYVGDGKMIHAPRTGDVVKISKLHKDLTAIRRVLPDAPAAAAAPSASSASSSSAASALSAAATTLSQEAVATITQALAGSVGVSATPTMSAQAVPAGAASGTLASALRSAALTPATLPEGTPAPDTWDAAVAAALKGQAAAGLAEAPGSAAASTTASLAGTGSTGGTGGAALAAAPARYQELFRAAEAKHGVSANLLAAVAKQESNFSPTAVSRAGARGLMQLMPGTARSLGVKDAFDPAQAVDGAARLLRSHLRTFGSTELALAAYNAGAGAVRRYDGIPPYRETQNYVRTIMANVSKVAA